MGALFLLLAMFTLFGLVYPAFMALVWCVGRLMGNDEKFIRFMSEI